MSSERHLPDDERPAFYALTPGGWRDYWTLLHPPYTIWHLSYVVMGASLAPVVNVRWLVETLIAFFLAMGIAAHALDELHGRPLGTRIPDAVLWALAAIGLAGAVALGIDGAREVSPWIWAFIAAGVFLVLAYNLELFGGSIHSDLWFALAWGAFPVLTGVLRADGTHRTGGGRAGRRVRVHLCGATGPVDARPTAPTPRRDGRGNDHVARRRTSSRSTPGRSDPLRSERSDGCRSRCRCSRWRCCCRSCRAKRRSSSSRPLRSIDRRDGGRAPRTRSRTGSTTTKGGHGRDLRSQCVRAPR